ncbi:MAG: hypothetical protein ACXVFT_11450 [Solirubrobacteraceae bacterium]
MSALLQSARVALATAAVIAFGATAAQAATMGPFYPLQDAPSGLHGGSSCRSSGPSPGQGTKVWVFGGADGTANSGGTTCATGTTGAAPPVGFDTSRFGHLYWSFSHLAWGAAGRCSGANITPGGGTDPTHGHVEMVDSTGCKLDVQVSQADSSIPLPLVDPATAGITPPAGSMPYYVDVTGSTTSFAVSFSITMASGAPLDQVDCNPGGTCDSTTDLQGSFWLTSHPPSGDFTFTPAADGARSTLSVGTLSDTDGTVAGYSWDLDGDGAYGEAAGQPNPQTGPLGPGAHTVGLEITDNEGAVTNVTHTINVANAPSTGDFTGSGGSGSGGSGSGAGAGSGPVADTTPPKAAVAILKQKLAKALKSGIKATFSADEPATAALTLTLPKALAKKLKLKGAIGRAAPRLTTAGKVTFTIKVSKAAAKKLKKLKKVSLVLAGTAKDAAGNSAAIARAFALKK